MKGRVVRAVFAAALAAGCGSAWAEISAGSYVRDGLVIQYDGSAALTDTGKLENLGSAGGAFDLTPVTAEQDKLVDGWIHTDSGWVMSAAVAAEDALFGPGYAVEYYAKQTGIGSKDAGYYFAVGMSLKETSGAGGENMPLTLGSAGANSTGVIVGGLTATWSGNTYKPTGKVSSSVAATRTGLVDASGSKMISYYENGVKIGSSATAGATVFGIRRINLGDLRAKRGCYWKGDYRSVRIYTRELTPDEITYNALVDRVRFEDVDPSTADWPEGYRYDAESGAMQAKLSVAFDAHNGGVTVDGAAVGPDYESWRTLSATPETVTLVATPAEGCTFVCWSGLTAGFDVKAATISVPVSTARALSAVFLPMATADSYVKAGLVFQLDGIDNAAQGAHEDLLSVWKDRVGSADITLDGATVGADSVILTKALATQMPAMTWKYPITVEAAARNTKYLNSNKLNPLLFSINNCTTLNIDFRNGNTRFEFCWPTSADVVNRSHYRTANLGDYAVATNFHTYSATSWASSGRMYFDGRPATRDTNKINDDAKASPTGAATIGNADANTAFHSVRVYDRALTDAEASCNAAIDRMRFATVTDAASVALPDGYRLNASGKLEVRVVTMCETAFGTLDLAGQGAKTLDERWVEQGTEVSVTAAPASDAPYVWTIFDIAEKTVAGDTCTFRATAPAEVRARTTKALYVSGANGVDDARRGVSTAPYRTIGYAVAHGVEGDEIRVAGGLYREAVTNTTARRTKSYIGFSGSWNESFTVRDLRNNRTVVKPPDALVGKTPCFTIDNGTNTIAGFTLTGGSSAIQQLTPRTLTISGDPARTETYVNEREDQHSYFRQLICTNNTYGFNLSSGFPAAAVSSSIVAKNAQYAYYIATDHGTRTYFNNCTFGDNDDVAYRTWNWTSYLHGQNNVFIGNNRVIHNTKSTSYAHDFTDSLFYRNGCLFRYEAGLDKALPGCALSVNGKVYMSDPKLGADYAPSADSECRGHGADLSAHARCPVTEDVYGQPFGDRWDLGAVRASDAEPSERLADVYVATTGDDANTGADAEHPMKSVNNALARVAENGTVHLADGVYRESVALAVPGVKLVGESRDGTVVEPEVSALEQESGKYMTYNWAVGFFEHGISVSNLTVRNAYSGFFTQKRSYGDGSRLDNCVSRGNLHGYFVMTDLSDARTPNRISHSQFRDNVWYGILSYIPLNVDNVLVADNGSDGMRVSFNYNNANCDIAFLTATANGGWGYVNGNGNPNTVTFANSVFEGNLGGAVFGKPNKFTAEKCCFHGNGADGATDFTAGSEPKLLDPIYGDPLLDTTDTLRGHLGNGSPCAQSGVNKAFASLGDLVDDLDYTARNAEKVDVGCFISPETMKDLAGHGYHVVSLHGAPNGYGEPNPAYGDHLLKDGPQTIDLSCTLHTDDADGARCYTLSDGVRVAYKGYLAREEGSSQPVESETEETFAFTLRENTDVTVRWELQDRVVVDARAKGCLVKVNDFAAGACVTNWVTHGTAVSVTFLPSDNWTLDQWAGDLPAGTDPKTYTIGWTSDQPRSVYTLAKAVHYVAPKGSDEDGTGEKDRPWRTIGHAIADASVQAGEVINVQAGVYEESVTNATAFGGKDGLTLSGGWDESWTLSPKTAKTVVTPPAGWRKQVPCLYMDTALNTVTYMTFRGGSTGIRALSTKGTANSETSHHEFRGIVVTDCVDGIDFTGCNLGLALEASLVAANDGCGFRHDAANTGYDYVYNCTFAENGATAVERKQNALASGFFRNCVFDRNGRHYWKAGSSNSDTFQNCCFGAATSNLMLHVAIKKTGVTDRKVSFNEKFMCAEPLLDAEYRPTAESPFLGMGTNLVEAAVAPFGSDVEGTLWNGVWDYGCYKSATAPLPKRAELYVSVDGDDVNDGTAPERAKRTIGGAIAHAAENGVISVGPGTFDLGNSVYVRGLEIRGAGPLLTKLESDLPFVAGQVETALYGFQFWTSGAKVSGFGVKGAFEGVRTPGYKYAYLNEVANCRFERGFAGVRLGGGDNSGSAPKNTFHAFDRCVIADNVWRGVDAGGTIHLTSSLVVRNGAHGFYGSTGDQFESDYIVNTTFKDNTGTAVESTSGWASGHRFLNCVIAGSTVGVQRTDERYSNGIYLYNCVVDNETNYNKVHNDMLAAGSMGGIYLSTPSIEADPLVKDDGRLEVGSPCLGAGIDPKKVSVTVRPERYLDGNKINYHAGKCAVGCMTIPNGLKIIVK